MATVAVLTSNIANRLRDSQLSSRIVDAINWTRREIQRRHPWGWAETGVGSIRTVAQASYTSVTVTSGSASVTVDSNDTAQQQITTDLAAGIYGYIKFDGTRFYRIIARSYSAPTTTLTITPAYIGSTSSSATATVYFREYALPSDCVRLGAMVLEDGTILSSWWQDDLWYLHPRPQDNTGKPARFCLKEGTAMKAVLDPIPDTNYSIQFQYEVALSDVTSSSTEAQVIVPARWHNVLEEGALYYLRRDYKDDTRWKDSAGRFESMLSQMIYEDVTNGGRGLPIVQPAGSKRGMERQRVGNSWGYGR